MHPCLNNVCCKQGSQNQEALAVMLIDNMVFSGGNGAMRDLAAELFHRLLAIFPCLHWRRGLLMRLMPPLDNDAGIAYLPLSDTRPSILQILLRVIKPWGLISNFGPHKILRSASCRWFGRRAPWHQTSQKRCCLGCCTSDPMRRSLRSCCQPFSRLAPIPRLWARPQVCFTA